jgi:hypothetical protein
MKNLKKITTLFVAFSLLSVITTSCSTSNHVGCPGKDRPSFKSRYSMQLNFNAKVNPTVTDKKIIAADFKV